MPHRKPVAKKQPNLVHDAPFKPSNPPKVGHNKTLEKFPEYKENPPKRVTRKVVVDGEEVVPGFKPT